MITIVKIPTEQGLLYRVCDMFTLKVYLVTGSEEEAIAKQKELVVGKA